MRGARKLQVAIVVLAAALAGCDKPTSEPKEKAVSIERIAGPAGSIRVDDGGAGGLPVVFAHSYGGSSAHWSAQLKHLRPTRRAVAFDFRAHGKSTPSNTGDYSVDALAQDIGAVVDALGLERFVLIGHSQGASAALAYAAKQPQRVAGLMLVGVPGKVPKEQSHKIVASIESDYDKTMGAYWDKLLSDAQPNVRAQIEREAKSVPKDVSIALIKALFDDDPLASLERYPGPKLIVATSHNDQPTDLVRLAPDVPNRMITGTSHWPHLDKPDEFNRLIDDFLAGLR